MNVSHVVINRSILTMNVSHVMINRSILTMNVFLIFVLSMHSWLLRNKYFCALKY